MAAKTSPVQTAGESPVASPRRRSPKAAETPVPGPWTVLLPELGGALCVFLSLTGLLALYGPDQGALLLKLKWNLLLVVGRHAVGVCALLLGLGVLLLSRRHRATYAVVSAVLLAWVVLLPPLDHLLANALYGRDVLKVHEWVYSAGGLWGRWVAGHLVRALGAWGALLSYGFLLLVVAWFKTGLSFKALMSGVETGVEAAVAGSRWLGQALAPWLGWLWGRMGKAGGETADLLRQRAERERALRFQEQARRESQGGAPPAPAVRRRRVAESAAEAQTADTEEVTPLNEEEADATGEAGAQAPPADKPRRGLARFKPQAAQETEENEEEEEVILHQEITSLEGGEEEVADDAAEALEEEAEDTGEGEGEDEGDDDFEVQTVGLCSTGKTSNTIQERRHDDITYLLPPTFLLSEPVEDTSDFDHAEAERLRQTLDDFKVQAKITRVLRGPNVTRYELTLPRGVKVKKIVELQDEIAMALAAQSVRIQAPIPGKNAIGVELPRKDPVVVRMREILDSEAFKGGKSKLTIAVGKDVTGQPVVANLASMPHLLIAGATGQGKSVCLNVLITSLVMKATPFEVKLILIDPKRVEFPIYSRLPHLLCPVVEDSRQAINALQWVADEMTRRYDLLKQHNKRNVDDYNNTIARYDHEKLPRIVVIVDELNDLLMTSLKRGNVEELICRIAQLARAAGIHLVLATQRPDVKVITGTIKANIPCRIAFATTSQIDSRTIIDLGGAEKLLGRGDMLFLNGGRNIQRLQGAFVDEAEIEKTVNFCAEQIAPMYNEEILTFGQEDEGEDNLGQYTDGVDDDRFEDAVRLVLSTQTASTSFLQRKLGLGYNRAARLIDLMEEKGIVDAADPSKPSAPRKVLVAVGA